MTLAIGVKEGKVRVGDWVTLSKAYAEVHGDGNIDGDYRVIEERVPASQLYWDGNDINEWGFDDGKEYKYKNTENNRKLNDLVTRDDDGNVIPPSRRFDEGSSDVRYKVGENRRLSEGEADELISQMEDHAEVAPVLELTPENWEKEFGKGNRVATPIGEVKLGENQYAKLIKEKREGEFGMVRPTLERPDVIIEEYSPEEGAERQSKYVFIKSFIDSDGVKHLVFMSATVKKEGMEIAISNHMLHGGQPKRKILQGKLLWNRFEPDSDSSDETQASDASTTNSPSGRTHGSYAQSGNSSSEGKVTMFANANQEF